MKTDKYIIGTDPYDFTSSSSAGIIENNKARRVSQEEFNKMAKRYVMYYEKCWLVDEDTGELKQQIK